MHYQDEITPSTGAADVRDDTADLCDGSPTPYTYADRERAAHAAAVEADRIIQGWADLGPGTIAWALEFFGEARKHLAAGAPGGFDPDLDTGKARPGGYMEAIRNGRRAFVERAGQILDLMAEVSATVDDLDLAGESPPAPGWLYLRIRTARNGAPTLWGAGRTPDEADTCARAWALAAARRLVRDDPHNYQDAEAEAAAMLAGAFTIRVHGLTDDSGAALLHWLMQDCTREAWDWWRERIALLTHGYVPPPPEPRPLEEAPRVSVRLIESSPSAEACGGLGAAVTMTRDPVLLRRVADVLRGAEINDRARSALDHAEAALDKLLGEQTTAPRVRARLADVSPRNARIANLWRRVEVMTDEQLDALDRHLDGERPTVCMWWADGRIAGLGDTPEAARAHAMRHAEELRREIDPDAPPEAWTGPLEAGEAFRVACLSSDVLAALVEATGAVSLVSVARAMGGAS